MQNLLEKKYVHIGNNKIQKDLWYDVQNNGKKPIGGLWTSPYIEECICDWIENISMNPEQYINESITHGCFIKLNPNAKICYVQSEKKLREMKEYLGNSILDFEKLSKNYDLFYVNPEGLKSFYHWTVRTMLILNINAIESYIPFDIGYEEVSSSYNHFFIKKMYDKKNVEEHTDSYYQIFNLYLEKYASILSLTNKNIIKRKLLEECKDIIKQQNLYGICDTIVENEIFKIKKLKR